MLDRLFKSLSRKNNLIEKCREGSLKGRICEYIKNFENPSTETMHVDDARYVVLDLETTGLNIKKDSILSIGAVGIQNREIVIDDSFERLIKYDKEIVKETVVVHGIMPSASIGAEDELVVLNDFLDYIKGDVLIAHYAPFDISMLNQLMKKHYRMKLLNKSLDTIALSMRLQSLVKAQIDVGRGVYSLDSLCEKYNIPKVDRHTAIGDAFITAQLFLKLMARAKRRGIKNISSLVNTRSIYT